MKCTWSKAVWDTAQMVSLVALIVFVAGCSDNSDVSEAREGTPKQSNVTKGLRKVLEAQTTDELLRSVGHDSPLVRALVARRVARLAVKDPRQAELKEYLLDVALVDPHPLVRANAIIAAHQLEYVPQRVMHALVMDDRGFVDLGELFDFREKKRANVLSAAKVDPWPERVSDATQQLSRRIVTDIEPENRSTLHLVPIGTRRRIGAVAAAHLIEQDSASLRTVQGLVEYVGTDSLRRQLTGIIERALKEAGK